MILSILIPTIPERCDQLINLKAQLYGQIWSAKLRGKVEVIVLIDNKIMSIGEKRNRLLAMAKGKYIAFVDDDDAVSDTYIKDIISAVKTSPDVVGINLVHYVRGELRGHAEHSIIHSQWENILGPDRLFEYFRCPNHLNPVKRSLAKKIKFPKTWYGEDKNYSVSLLPLLKSEVMIKEPIYYYMDNK